MGQRKKPWADKKESSFNLVHGDHWDASLTTGLGVIARIFRLGYSASHDSLLGHDTDTSHSQLQPLSFGKTILHLASSSRDPIVPAIEQKSEGQPA